ncbi:MAG: hypothetical protein HOV92_22255 [Streptomyces sp.]|nr:hypothetical protein [Streptomyces sp.]NUS86406.1 hypothetical protein [Streptomyces sp.]
MGYKAKTKNITIRFAEDHEYHGAEAVLRGMTYGEWEIAVGLDGGEGQNTGAASVKDFVEHLISWNLEDEMGQPLPITMDAVKAIDKDLIAALNNAWIQALIGVHDADPLPDSSPSGEPSLVESVPMEALSPSLAS